jgi:HSP20 family protein
MSNEENCGNYSCNDFFDYIARYCYDERAALTRRGITGDFEESDEKYTLKVTLPGIERENVELDVVEGTLSLTVKLDEEDTFKRSVNLSDAKDDSITATLKNGVLEVIVPKLEKKRIDIA